MQLFGLSATHIPTSSEAAMALSLAPMACLVSLNIQSHVELTRLGAAVCHDQPGKHRSCSDRVLCFHVPFGELRQSVSSCADGVVGCCPPCSRGALTSSPRIMVTESRTQFHSSGFAGRDQRARRVRCDPGVLSLCALGRLDGLATDLALGNSYTVSLLGVCWSLSTSSP